MDPLDLLDEDNAKTVTGLEYSRRKKTKQDDNNFKSLLSQTLNKSFKSENENENKNDSTTSKINETKVKENTEYIPTFLNSNSRSKPPKDKDENLSKNTEMNNSSTPNFEINSRRRKTNTVNLSETKSIVEVKEKEKVTKQINNKFDIIDEDEPYIPSKTNVNYFYLRMLIQ